ncbi:hypothetical protein BLNAU_24609 [Blattamonas nauphoetae]|uniref:Uncharacterized protein n=1 Tax=Blattamonas nauphoetae TaxID=2049346 RepID=A0ABQ9WLZ2_9EUKA|nr:hypothetical protein BLNAU_24609 [Blattamonas nauphoetae]
MGWHNVIRLAFALRQVSEYPFTLKSFDSLQSPSEHLLNSSSNSDPSWNDTNVTSVQLSSHEPEVEFVALSVFLTVYASSFDGLAINLLVNQRGRKIVQVAPLRLSRPYPSRSRRVSRFGAFPLETSAGSPPFRASFTFTRLSFHFRLSM